MERAKPDLKAEAQRTLWTRTNSSTSGEMLKLHSWYDGVVSILLQWQFNRCINIDSIWFYPRHSFLSPSFVPSSAFASPERVNSHLHFTKKMFPKVQFSCMSFTKKKRTSTNQQIRKKVSQKHQLLNGSNCEFQRPSASPLFSPSLLSPSLGSSSCQSHKATWLKLIEKFKQLYVYIYILYLYNISYLCVCILHMSILCFVYLYFHLHR